MGAGLDKIFSEVQDKIFSGFRVGDRAEEELASFSRQFCTSFPR